MLFWIVQTLVFSCLFALLDALYRYLRARQVEGLGGSRGSPYRPAALGAALWMWLLFLQSRQLWQAILGGVVWFAVAMLIDWGLRRLRRRFSQLR